MRCVALRCAASGRGTWKIGRTAPDAGAQTGDFAQQPHLKSDGFLLEPPARRRQELQAQSPQRPKPRHSNYTNCAFPGSFGGSPSLGVWAGGGERKAACRAPGLSSGYFALHQRSRGAHGTTQTASSSDIWERTLFDAAQWQHP
ncbi:hypothetical protein M440DRAFT_1187072 [Trichoderma longibrachiatum ATCC 18648]|uniref:Uncharacterized protein n=1 Tax=Trichoderma longibrachiatum ATCC 18648 TaxID=983965 RepID=A0A2T4C9J0_TRILO|nr:hypothetical protein M440DRAFT_1187072 [Trichoderma longibrachiatum ATCC 18648]